MISKEKPDAWCFAGLEALSVIASARASRGKSQRSSIWGVAYVGHDGLIPRRQVHAEAPQYEQALLVADKIAAQLGQS